MALRVTEGAALGAAIQAAWTYYRVKGQPLTLGRLVEDLVLVEKKTRAEPDTEAQVLYRDLLLRRTGLTRNLKTGGFL